MLDQSLSNSSSPDKQLDSGLVLGMHRGALDRDFVTSLPPKEVMQRVDETLRAMGIEVEPESKCNYSCARPKRASVEEGGDVEKSSPTGTILYGGPESDLGGEVRFTVELTTISNLSNTYSLDVRRKKGNLRSYKFLYDTIRERLGLNSS
ncbi:hypothetical protein BJ165DRAFT_355320 [Panaeolus papilionaceus]|nr:hypothetical protein BJ165DRAFT_355320 [Panaeolus papilionaceus]